MSASIHGLRDLSNRSLLNFSDIVEVSPTLGSCWVLPGPTQKPQINLVGNPGEFLGVTEFGFSKKNELFVGEGPQSPRSLVVQKACHTVRPDSAMGQVLGTL